MQNIPTWKKIGSICVSFLSSKRSKKYLQCTIIIWWLPKIGQKPVQRMSLQWNLLVSGHVCLFMILFWVAARLCAFACLLSYTWRMEKLNIKSFLWMVRSLHSDKVSKIFTPQIFSKSKSAITLSIFVVQQPFTYHCNQHQKFYLTKVKLLRYNVVLKKNRWNTYLYCV